MAVNYSDDRLVAVEREENKATTELNKTYNDMIAQSNSYYQAQIDASKQYADKQAQVQQEKTDFAIEKIEQQKDQAEKDYTREQSGAYVDWQKESNRYGANAEQMASNGFVASGYGESSQVSMFNTYQNRVATARDVHNRAMLNYDNNIQEAKLQNDSILAEIYANAYKEQSALALQQFQYHNQLVTEKLEKKTQLQQIYHQQYQDVLDQINQEKALAEQIRQYNLSLAEERRQYNQSMAFQREQFEYQKAQASKSSGGGSSRSSSSGSKSSSKGSGSGGSVGSVNKQKSDAETYGTFSNGYQPKGISGYGKVAKTGDKVIVNGKTQNLWQTHDGTLWYWDGSTRTYKKTTRASANKQGSASSFAMKQIQDHKNASMK